MKKKVLLVCLMAPLFYASWAYNFSAVSSNGQTLYYTIVDQAALTCELGEGEGYNDSKGVPTTEYVGDIVVPETVEYNGDTYTVVGLGENAFCYSTLTSVSLPETLTYLGDYAFYNCLHIEELVLPDGITTFGTEVFNECERLVSVHLPAELTSIPKSSFDDCKALKEIVIPDKVTEIGQYGFRNCSALTSVVTGEGLTSIGDRAFGGSKALETVVLGPAVEKIYQRAFVYGGDAGSQELTAVYSYNSEPPARNGGTSYHIFESFDLSTVTLYVPAGSVDTYATADQWKDFGTILPIEEEPTTGTFTISEAGYATYYTENEYTMPEGVAGSTVTGVGGEASDGGYYLTMAWEYEAGKTVPAGTALVLQGEADTYEYEITSTGVVAPTDNLLLGSTTETTTYGLDEGATYVFYELTNGSSGIGFYYGAENGVAFTSAANKAWLPLTTDQARNARFVGFGHGDTTGITSVEASDAMNNGAIYTLQGVRVSDMSQKGVYIVNGKKVHVK